MLPDFDLHNGDYRQEFIDLNTAKPTMSSSWLAVIVLSIGITLAVCYIALADAPAARIPQSTAHTLSAYPISLFKPAS